MSLKLMYITNEKKIAKIAENSGVDWIFIDLETKGKKARQGHLDTVISNHSIEDIKKIKKVLTKSELLVRVDPIYEDSKIEIDRVINNGADIVMLPYFKTRDEVKTFIDIVNNRAKICLLFETSEAVENIDSILNIPGIQYIHIGLNDLHLSYNMNFMFELLENGTVDFLCKKFKNKGVTYGFGGIAQLGQGKLPAENILAEHYRLGSNMVILARSFYNAENTTDLSVVEDTFKLGVNKIRQLEDQLSSKGRNYFNENQKFIKKRVLEIVNINTKSAFYKR